MSRQPRPARKPSRSRSGTRQRISASLVGLTVSAAAAGGAGLTPAGCGGGVAASPQARVADELSRSVRASTAKIELLAVRPFGAALTLSHYRLGNGLEVLILPERAAPVVSYQTWFRVGSRHERQGKTGLAHLFEHLMFNETRNLPAGEFDRLMESAGGETNAATWVDWTYYYENVPAAELPLVVRLEADRMSNLVLREPQVRSEKDVVTNERAMRVDDDVEGSANEVLYRHAFRRHPYHWPTIGWREDIASFTTADCREFYRTFYAPNNAVLVIAGDVDEREALRLVQQHYGALRPARLPEEPRIVEPPQRAERRVTIRRPTPTDKLQIGYRAPAFGDYDHAVLVVLNEVLFGGRSSRLYRALVSEGELAAEVRGSVAPFRDPGLYEIWASAREGHDAEAMSRVLDREIERARTTGITAAELEKAKNRLELAFLQGMETASGKAEQIGFYAAVLRDPGRVFTRLDDYRRVTREDVRRVAQTVLDPRRRTVVVVRPDGSAPADGDVVETADDAEDAE